MKDLMRVIFLNLAIYSGAIFANSDDINIIWVTIFDIACIAFVMTKDDKK